MTATSLTGRRARQETPDDAARQDHRDAPQLPVARRPAGPHAAPHRPTSSSRPVVRRERRPDRAAAGHRAARLRGRDRARHRHAQRGGSRPSEGWEHVGWVTAANDFGLYDLRSADRGSNVRSKGGDGFTPLGPALIDAADVDPAALRLRTWVNGELVQDDTSARAAVPLRPARRRPVPADHPRAGRRHPHRHARRVARGRARATWSRSRSTRRPPRARRAPAAS